MEREKLINLFVYLLLNDTVLLDALRAYSIF